MTHIHIRDATFEDIDIPGVNIREADQLEWQRGGGMPLRFGYALCLAQWSQFSKVAEGEDGVPLLWWGGRDGELWMFATEEAAQSAISLHRALLHQVPLMHSMWGTLFCLSDWENTKHHDWLRWLGFRKEGLERRG